MELLKDVLADFCLFSLIEGYIFCLFFEKIGGCNKFKWYEIFILSVINCLVSIILPPLLFQFIGLLYMSIFLNLKFKIKIINCIKISLLASIYMLILEMFYSVILSLFLDINSASINKIFLFIIIIPLRILEIYFLIKYKKQKELK